MGIPNGTEFLHANDLYFLQHWKNFNILLQNKKGLKGEQLKHLNNSHN